MTAATAVRDTLRNEIVSMRVLPGSQIQERELTVRFGVSRTPVREALLHLAEETLVEIRPQSGTYVARIPLAAVAEALIVRKALEGACVELAAAGLEASDMARLQDAVTQQRVAAASDERQLFHASDELFHETIAAVAGHPGIWRLLRPVKAQLDRARMLTLPVPGRMEQVITEHVAILAPLAAGDAEAARRAMHDHLSAVVPDTEALRSRYPSYFV